MSYSQIAVAAIVSAILLDLFGVKTKLVTKKVFWTSYAIIFPMQLITNWWLTSKNIVMYNPADIDGHRLAGAPIEDLLFGFALILGVLSMWIFLGRKGIRK